MARVEISQPTVTVSIASEPSTRGDKALTKDALLDFAAALGSHPIGDDTAILCSHGKEGHLTDLWVQVEVPLADLPEAGPDPECPGADCPHVASAHEPAGGSGCSECDCRRSRDRVMQLAKASA